MESQFPTEMPAQQPDLGRSPSVQVILGCIKQTIKSKHPKPESSLLMEHMWAGSHLGETCLLLELSPHSRGFHTPGFHCDSSLAHLVTHLLGELLG